MIIGDLFRDLLSQGLPVIGAALGAARSMTGGKPVTYRRMLGYTAAGWGLGWGLSYVVYNLWDRMQPGLPPPEPEEALPEPVPPEMAGLGQGSDGWSFRTPKERVQELLRQGGEHARNVTPPAAMAEAAKARRAAPTKRQQTGSRTFSQSMFGGAYGS